MLVAAFPVGNETALHVMDDQAGRLVDRVGAEIGPIADERRFGLFGGCHVDVVGGKPRPAAAIGLRHMWPEASYMSMPIGSAP